MRTNFATIHKSYEAINAETPMSHRFTDCNNKQVGKKTDYQQYLK